MFPSPARLSPSSITGDKAQWLFLIAAAAGSRAEPARCAALRLFSNTNTDYTFYSFTNVSVHCCHLRYSIFQLGISSFPLQTGATLFYYTVSRFPLKCSRFHLCHFSSCYTSLSCLIQAVLLEAVFHVLVAVTAFFQLLGEIKYNLNYLQHEDHLCYCLSASTVNNKNIMKL